MNSTEAKLEIRWNDRSGSAWVTQQERTDRQLAPLGRLALERLRLSAGDALIDVGCGCGQTLFELWERVAPSGRVLGVDISEPMLARARERVQASGLTQIELVQADAASYAFAEQAYAAVFSRFGVMFFEDSLSAFANLRRALRSGGQLAFVCWRALQENPWALLPLEAVCELLELSELPPVFGPEVPGPFRFADAAGLEELLSRAGFRAVRVEARAVPLRLGGGATLEEAVDYTLQIGPSARLLGEASEALREHARELLSEVFAPYVRADGVWLSSSVNVVSAER